MHQADQACLLDKTGMEVIVPEATSGLQTAGISADSRSDRLSSPVCCCSTGTDYASGL